MSFDGGATVEVMVAGGPNSRESEVIDADNDSDINFDGELCICENPDLFDACYICRSTILPVIPGDPLPRSTTLPLDQVACW